MDFVTGWLKKLTNYFPFFTGPNTENCEPADVGVPVSNKRIYDENCQEIVVSKRRKVDPISLNGFGDTFSAIGSMKMSNQRPLRSCRVNNRKTIGDVDFSILSNPRGKSLTMYSCDDSEVDNQNKLANCAVLLLETENCRNDEMSMPKKMNFITRHEVSQANKLHSTYVPHRSLLCKDRMTEEHSKEIYARMLQKHAGTATYQRKSLPLTTSTAHNTKQNNQVNTETPLFKGYYLRRYTSLSIESSNMTPAKETVADKTVIDLTNDDEERKIIEISVRNSPRLKNFTTSFVGKNTHVLEPDFIEKLVNKYDKRNRTIKSQVQNEKKKLQKKQEITDKSLVEILEKRLVLKEHVAEEKLTKDLAPITEKMEDEIRNIVSAGKDVLVRIKDTGIKASDIYTLQDCGWLNDEVINAYMNLIKIRSENDQENYPKVHCFNTFFYPQLLNRGYGCVRRWTKKIDVFDHALIVIPIHLGNHWCLAEIRTKDRVIKYYDSFGSPNNRCLETMLQYLISEHEDKKGKKLDVSRWKVINVPRNEIPNQKNAYDCGVFACTYAEHITRNASFNFSQEDMSYFREKMTYEILTGHLLL